MIRNAPLEGRLSMHKKNNASAIEKEYFWTQQPSEDMQREPVQWTGGCRLTVSSLLLLTSSRGIHVE